MPPETQDIDPADRDRVEHMLATARDAVTILGAMDADDLRTNMVHRRALVNCFTEIGEAAARLSYQARQRVGAQPWGQIVGMRHIIVHVYWGIDLNEIVKTVRHDLPGFIASLQGALASWPHEEEQ